LSVQPVIQEKQHVPTANAVQPSTHDEKLSFWTKMAYAIGGLGGAVGPGTIIPFWYTIFLTDIAQLDLGLVSVFWVIVTVWDAINNPLAGYLSDRTRTRWGRRRPFLLFGAVPFGVLFILLWWIPPTERPTLLFAYYLVTYILFETTFTAVSCPYQALTPELTQDHDERTSLVMYQMVVTIAAGVLVPVLFGLVIFPMFPRRDPRAYQALGVICGIGFIPAYLTTFFGTRERPEFQQESAPPLRETAQFVLRNKPFRYTLAIYVLGWMPVTIAQALFAYYFIYWIGMSEDEVSLVQGLIMTMAWLLLPVVLWMARRLEKKSVYIIAAGSWAVIMLATLMVPEGAKLPAYILCALSGFGIAAIHLLPSAMLPDVLEVDELTSGRRQEGAYAGVTVFAGKLGQTAVLALLPMVLRWSGYIRPGPENPKPIQPYLALLTLRLLIAVMPALLLGASMVVAWFYPLTRQRHAEIRQELETRREG
jgi:GPH family glycoside/pentoside/hexuronide:cation symporter